MTVDSRVAWALRELDERFAQEVRVEQLARAVNLSVSHFTRVFRQQTGLAPAQYLRNIRLERARVLLETTFLSVKQVMAAVGVNDASHFSRDFRRAFGVSPRGWRTRVERAPPVAAPPSAQFDT